jgi:predicted lipid-binding transport protein (Tim44 family)
MHIFELLFFAVVAFLIISKLIATLGATNEEDTTRYKSFFGEKSAIKDVTDTIIRSNDNQQEVRPNPLSNENIDDVIDINNKENILKNLATLQSRLPNFSPSKFLRGAKTAFKMIIDAGTNKDDKLLGALVDKRYLEQFGGFSDSYGKISKIENLQGKISDLYMFGNNVFIKILFAGNDIFSNNKTLNQEWTFIRSLIVPSPDWHLTNIEQI